MLYFIQSIDFIFLPLYVLQKKVEGKMIKIDLKQRKREVLGVIAILFVIVTGMSIYKYASFSSGF